MYGRGGLDRFKKAQSLEPFSVSLTSAPKTTPKAVQVQQHSNSQNAVAQPQHEEHTQSQPTTQLGGSQSTWQPPDWAIDPRPGVYYLQVLKEGQVLDRINLDRRRHIFGRQYHTCDFVLDHQSVSCQHAAVILHKNGRSLLFLLLFYFLWPFLYLYSNLTITFSSQYHSSSSSRRK